jgi:integrase
LTGAEHLVPLAAQAIAVLEQIKALSGNREHVFPNEHNPQEWMSENIILFALYRMGYRGRATGHGFRATASTVLNEQGWRADVIERQLAHAEKNKVRAACHRSQHQSRRTQCMMQSRADYLDGLASGAKVRPIRRQAA